MAKDLPGPSEPVTLIVVRSRYASLFLLDAMASATLSIVSASIRTEGLIPSYHLLTHPRTASERPALRRSENHVPVRSRSDLPRNLMRCAKRP